MVNEKKMKSVAGKKCKVCGDKTTTVFNIDFKAIPVCESCAASIFIQQATWYIKQP
jgi:hypothetical protein